MDLRSAGKQKYNRYIVRRDPGNVGDCGQRVSAWRCAFASAMEPGRELKINGYYAVEYADDIAILINGKFLQTVSEVLQTALFRVKK
jgi:hypothetical protein